MTLAREKHTPRERQIAKALGISDAQLDALLRIRAGYWPANAATALVAKGYAVRGEPYVDGGFNVRNSYGRLTEAGEALLARARAMGF